MNLKQNMVILIISAVLIAIVFFNLGKQNVNVKINPAV